MIRPLALPLLAGLVLAFAGCDARSSAGLPNGSHVEGGYGSAFYAEVAQTEKETTRIHLFGTVQAFDEFVATKQVNELGHKKFIGKGRNRETLVVETSKGDAGLTDKLVARYLARLPMPAASPATSEVAPPAASSRAAFYSEVPHTEKGTTRIHLFGTEAACTAFKATKQIDELNHKKFIGQGRNRETLVVETAKGDPGLADRLVARYLAEHP